MDVYTRVIGKRKMKKISPPPKNRQIIFKYKHTDIYRNLHKKLILNFQKLILISDFFKICNEEMQK